MKRILGIAALALTLGGNAVAQEGGQDAPRGRPHTHWWLELDADLSLSWYAGAGIGQSRFHDYELLDDGSFTSRNDDDTGTSLRVFGGMGIGKYLALEVAYADFGEATTGGQSDGSGTVFNAGPQSVEIEVDAYEFSLVGRLPLGDDFGLFAKIGQTVSESSAAISIDAQSGGTFDGTFTDDDSALTYGGGVHYDGLRPVRIVAEYGVLPFEPAFFSDTTLDWLALSVAYLF
jgi:hypothetical protein